MALTFEYCISCGGKTQVDTRVDPEDRRCMLCGEPCSAAEAEDAMEIPSAEAVAPDITHVPVELVASNCPHCEADIALDPDKPLTKKPLETRMGKGKGAPEMWVAVVQPGRILFEMEGVEGPLAKEAFRLAAHKLSIPTITVQRRSVAHGS